MPDLELLRAYCRTTYRVQTPNSSIDLHIGETSPELDRLLGKHNAEDWAFVTAANPRSEQLSDIANAQRNQTLLAAVEADGYASFPGQGIGADPTWPAEDSLLIIGINDCSALELARSFDQHAIVCGLRRLTACLRVCLPDEWRDVIAEGLTDSDPAVRRACHELQSQLRLNTDSP